MTTKEAAETLERQHALGVVAEGVGLSPRPDWVPAWDGLGADLRSLHEKHPKDLAPGDDNLCANAKSADVLTRLIAGVRAL